MDGIQGGEARRGEHRSLSAHGSRMRRGLPSGRRSWPRTAGTQIRFSWREARLRFFFRASRARTLVSDESCKSPPTAFKAVVAGVNNGAMRVRASAFAAWLVLAAATTLASAPAETSRAGVGAVGAGPEPSPPPCAARCASDCAAICARSCEAWTLARLPEGPAADVERAACEADDRTGKCGAASCEARCADARCDAGARAGSRTAATPPEDVRRESSSNDARREGGQGGSGARGGSPGATARTGASDAPRGRHQPWLPSDKSV